MSTPLELLSSLCFLTGGILCLTGGVGLLRLPDFYARVHAAGLTETLATPLLLCGLMLQMDWSADLIVIGSHGRSGWKLLLGSTANKVLHGSHCDILTVHVGE